MKRLIYYVFLPILFYPVYFVVANFFDTLFGDQQLINWLYFNSRSILLKTILSDWLYSFPVMYAILLLILPVEYIAKKITDSPIPLFIISMTIMVIISYVAGFRELGLVINAISVFFMIVVYCFSKTIFISEPNK